VDANVLIFERIKEELRSGRTMGAAIDIGFKRAWPSIRDSNASTLITCVILYIFGSNFGATLIIGFAINLAVGVLISLFTAVLVTRNFLNILLLSGVASHPAFYGLPANALPIARYNRPVSRLSGQPNRAVLVPAKATTEAAANGAARQDEDDETDDEALEPVGNVSNGNGPTAKRSGATGTSGGAEE
jgi:multidrug efflux pump subunit AcrB